MTLCMCECARAAAGEGRWLRGPIPERGVEVGKTRGLQEEPQYRAKELRVISPVAGPPQRDLPSGAALRGVDSRSSGKPNPVRAPGTFPRAHPRAGRGDPGEPMTVGVRAATVSHPLAALSPVGALLLQGSRGLFPSGTFRARLEAGTGHHLSGASRPLGAPRPTH